MQHQEAGFFSFLLACLSGAFVSAIRSRDGSLPERIGTGFIGFLMAYHLGPVIAAMFFPDPQYLASCGFVVGMIGKEVSTVIIDAARDYGPAVVRRFLEKKS